MNAFSFDNARSRSFLDIPFILLIVHSNISKKKKILEFNVTYCSVPSKLNRFNNVMNSAKTSSSCFGGSSALQAAINLALISSIFG